MFYKNKKGQVGETMTWVIATIVIIVILLFSIFISSVVGKNKEFKSDKDRDLVSTKSLSGYLLTEDDSGKSVFNQLKDEGNLNDFNGKLAQNIFWNIYPDPISMKGRNNLWLAICDKKASFLAFDCKYNLDYFRESACSGYSKDDLITSFGIDENRLLILCLLRHQLK